MQSHLKTKRRPRHNTPIKERKAIISLKKNSGIIIKLADKGGAIVIQNKEDYIKEGERQLKQHQHYKKLDNFEKIWKKFIKEVETETTLMMIHSRYFTDPIQEHQIHILCQKYIKKTTLEDPSSTV